MPIPLRFLILEDQPADAELMLHELRRAGFDPNWQRVETESDYLAHLDRALDLILADYHLPAFDALRALQHLQARGLGIPFIVVSDTIGEGEAVACMRRGATDYVPKDQLARLGSAVAHALDQRRLRAEQAQREQQLRLQGAALEAAANGIVITDREGTILWVNPAYTRLTGYSAEEAIGQNPRILKSSKHDQAFYQRLWQTILSGQVWRGETINKRKDGSLYTEDQTITPVRDERGVISHFIAIKEDITQRKRAEEVQARLSALLEATTDFVGICDAERRPVYINAGGRQLVGLGQENEIAGYTIRERHPEWARARIEGEGIPTAIREGVWRGETAVLARDGREIPVSQVIIAHKAPDGTLEYLSTIARDITEHKQFEASLQAMVEDRTHELQVANSHLEKASRHKSEFLTHMSHELRTPLNSILGFSELLKDETYGPLSAKQARYVGHIHQSGQHLLSLINDLLDLSKVEAGRLELRLEPLAIAEAIAAALHEIKPLADVKRLTLTLQAEAAPPTLLADPVRFKQILYNLLSNAIKFTPEAGRITVTARIGSRGEGLGSSEGSRLDPKPYTLYPGEFVEIAVADTGIGIKADDLSKLFQPFVQLEPALAKPLHGTGLGLALTKHLVELHGGLIAATSAGAGLGSTFTVRLPLTPPPPPPPPPVPRGGSYRASHGR